MPRGGARPGAGRKARAVKAVEATIAEHIFRKMGGEAKVWETLLRLGAGLNKLPDDLLIDMERAKFALQILMYWTDRKYGKPTQRTELAGGDGGAVSLIVDL